MPNEGKIKMPKVINNDAAKEAILKSSSYSGVREFNKLEFDCFMPRMSCPPELVKLFRQEARENKWSFTTLMTVILKERYESKGEQ